MAEPAKKAHLAIYLTFAAFGAIVGTHVGSFPVLVERAGLTPFQFGVAGSLGMLMNIGCMGLGGVINRFASHRTVLLIVIPAAAVALLGALLAQSVTGFFVSFLLVNACLGTMDLFMNAEASLVEHELGRPVFSTYHGSATYAVAAFAVVGSLCSVLLAPWFGIVLVAVPLALAWAAVYSHVADRGPVGRKAAHGKAPLPFGILTIIGLAAGFNVTCEVAAIQWSGQLLAKIAPDLAAISGLGLAFYGICGGTIRMFGDALRGRFGDFRVMLTSLVVAIAGFTGLGTAPGFWLSAFAFAAVGFGLALIFPCLFALAGRLVPSARAAAMSYAAFVGGVPRVFLPWLLGMLATGQSVNAVFGACAVFAACGLALIALAYGRAGADRNAAA